MCVHAKLLQLCPTLCNLMDHSPPDSSLCGHSPGKNPGVGCLCLSPGGLPKPGTEPRSLLSSPLSRGFFTTSATWEAIPNEYFVSIQSNKAGDFLYWFSL